MPEDSFNRLAALTTRMAAASDTAFREFHEAWFHRIFRYAFVLMRGDEAVARDVTQETLLRVVRHIRRFEREEDFWSWLTCLVRSAAADHGRKVSRYRRLLERFTIDPGSHSQPGPDTEFDVSRALQQGLAQLEAGDRQLLLRKYTEGASVRDLAKAMELSETAVESRLARARRDLRAIVSHFLKS